MSSSDLRVLIKKALVQTEKFQSQQARHLLEFIMKNKNIDSVSHNLIFELSEKIIKDTRQAGEKNQN